jgi:hypothetical protein
MNFKTFDVDKKRKRMKINIFKIGGMWCFKYFFGDRKIFEELSKYYNREEYRFELKTIGERNKVIKYLEEKGFNFDIIEDPSDYTVKIDVGVDIGRKKYVSMLKNSIDHSRRGMDRIFIMKDLASVEEAVMEGAERYGDGECNP